MPYGSPETTRVFRSAAIGAATGIAAVVVCTALFEGRMMDSLGSSYYSVQRAALAVLPMIGAAAGWLAAKHRVGGEAARDR